MFWKVNRATQSDKQNPFRALNADLYDGAKINRRARELRRAAGEGLNDDEIVSVLGTALGNQVASMVKKQPHLSIDEMLELVCQGVHEAAYIDANLPPKNYDRELMPDEFAALSDKLLNVAIANKVQPTDGMVALTKALGTLISFQARRQGCLAEELLRICNKATSDYANEATNYMRENPNTDPTKMR